MLMWDREFVMARISQNSMFGTTLAKLAMCSRLFANPLGMALAISH